MYVEVCDNCGKQSDFAFMTVEERTDYFKDKWGHCVRSTSSHQDWCVECCKETFDLRHGFGVHMTGESHRYNNEIKDWEVCQLAITRTLVSDKEQDAIDAVMDAINNA